MLGIVGSLHSFIYGRPVQGDEFLNREAELRTIFNRLRNGESTAIVGEPHIGKTSLLLQLDNDITQRTYLADLTGDWVVSFLDLHPIGNDYTPCEFWEESLQALREHPGRAATTRQLEQATQAKFARRSLERLFNYLAGQGRRLILLLDEFDRLLIHPNFQDPAFFARLRSLATYTGGLALVSASRLSVAEMNERGRGLLDIGSPFFNHFAEVRLYPFDENTVNALLARAGDVLSPHDWRFIRRVAGRHPFLLQAMAAALIETIGDDRHARAAERLYERVSYHFDDLWHTLDDRARTTAIILSLVELAGRALGQDFAYGEIERVDAFGPELRRLAERGLVERVNQSWQFDWQHLLLWRGERWTVGAQAFTWWTRDVVINRTRQLPTYEKWLASKRYRFLLTQQQWDQLIGLVQRAPEWAIRGVVDAARTLFDELMRGRK
jgi:hypothetical protein